MKNNIIILVFLLFNIIHTKNYSDLFKPTKIGSISTINHFIRSATWEGKATEEGYPTEACYDIYSKLGKGNIGIIITSYAYVANYERPGKEQLAINSDNHIPYYKKMTDYIHKNTKSKIIMQIGHGSAISQGDPEHAKIFGPTAMTNYISGLKSIEMSKQDILNVEQLFVDAAVRAKKAGFDGVQLHCAHGYLLSEFISPYYYLFV